MSESLKRVLLIEDNPDDLVHCKRLLKTAGGYDVAFADTGEAAKAMLRFEAYDSVLLDHDLPDVNGLELLEQIRADFPYIAIVMLTGLEDEVIAAQSIMSGANDYLPKSGLTTEALIHTLENAQRSVALQKELQQRNNRLEVFYQLLNQTDDPMFVFRVSDWSVFEVNAAACDRLGYVKQQLMQDREMVSRLLSGHDPKWTQFIRQILSAGAAQIEWELTLANGGKIPVEIIARLVNIAHESYIIGSARDIAHHKNLRAELEEMAQRDALTGIRNRRYFDDALAQEWQRMRRHGHNLAVLLIDVDHFKVYNDKLGHQAGDVCLKQLASAMNSAIRRSGEFVARYGGEEFVVLLPESDESDAAGLAQRLQKTIRNLAIPHPIAEGHIVTMSAGGAAAVPDAEKSTTELIEAADKALYQAKNDGRDCYRAFSTL